MTILSRVMAVAVTLLFCGTVVSLGSTVGVLGAANGAFTADGNYTIVELGSPADQSGSVSAATFLWSAVPCQATVSVRFFRPEPLPFSTTLHFLASRGPFDVLSQVQSVTLVPPVPLLKGDLVAISRVNSCGSAVSGAPPSPLIPPPHGSVMFTGDVNGDVVESAGSPGPDVIVQAQDNASLLLLSGRFSVTLTATNPRSGALAVGYPVTQNDRFGYFSLPAFTGDPSFPEVLVKMADATLAPPPFGGSFWVFYAPLTDVNYELTFTDLLRGTERVYTNVLSGSGQLCGGVDTSAFPP
jgi:hypothetical protein